MAISFEQTNNERSRMTETNTSLLNLVMVASGGIATALGLGVLVGWYTHQVILIQVHPAFVPMQYNTALGFLLCGIGLLSGVFGRGWRRGRSPGVLWRPSAS